MNLLGSYFVLILSLLLRSSDTFFHHSIWKRAFDRLNRLRFLERRLVTRPDFSNGHFFISRAVPEARVRYNTSLLFEFATSESAKSYGGLLPSNVDDSITLTDSSPLHCDANGLYRTYDGTCNNLVHPRWGSGLRPLQRLFPASYEDGISKPRIRSDKLKRKGRGLLLPLARRVSNVVHGKRNSSTDTRHSLMLMQWGQFLDHDISFTPIVEGLDGNEGQLLFYCGSCNSSVHPACFPIKIPRNDPFFPYQDPKTKERKCISFVRSMPGQERPGLRDQVNQNTGYLDCSHIYGSSKRIHDELRQWSEGKLRVLPNPVGRVFKPLMPMTENLMDCQSQLGMCFHAGDGRSNEQPGLTCLHTLYVRYHNYVADHLRIRNPTWSDEIVFQEARRVVIAVNQHITYNEFLPQVLGPKLIQNYDLKLEDEGSFYDNYRANCSADIYTEFSTAAFRFGHSLVSPVVKMIRNFAKRGDINLKISRHFNNPDVIQNFHFIDDFVSGLTSQGMEEFDQEVNYELRNRLFENKSTPFSGMDLVAINIQRGRDHGIPGYIHYVHACFPNIPKISDFKGLQNFIGDEGAVKKLRSVYRHVDDIDLFSGGLSEQPVPGGIVGPTFGCLISSQFRNLRRCDRFWYELRGEFTKEQLAEIKKVTLSTLICLNCDFPRPIQRRSMNLPNPKTNPLVDCNLHPKINFDHWTNYGKGLRGSFISFEKGGGACEVGGRVWRVGMKQKVSPCVFCECNRSSQTPICTTLVIKSCISLINEYGTEALSRDQACLEQCSEELN